MLTYIFLSQIIDDFLDGGEEEEQEHVGPLEDPLPPDGPETLQFKEQRNDYEREWPSVQAMLTGTINLEPINVEIENRVEEVTFKEAQTAVERKLCFHSSVSINVCHGCLVLVCETIAYT